MRRPERGTGASAEIAAAGDGDDAAAVRGGIGGPRERDPREPKVAGRFSGGDLRGAEFAARSRDLAGRMLRSEETAANLRQRGPSCRGASKSKGKPRMHFRK